VAVIHTILGIVNALLTSGEPFHDLGTNYFDQRDVDHVKRRLTRRIGQPGCIITLEPQVA
jgi:hypothetical protein